MLESDNKNKFSERRKFLQWSATTGAAALLILCSGCNPENDKVQYIPLEELIEHPEMYEKLDNITTRGFLEHTGTINVMVPVTFNQSHLISTPMETYALHAYPSIDSPSLLFSSSKSIHTPYEADGSPDKHLLNEQHEISGKLQKATVKKGGEFVDSYSFVLYADTVITTPTLKPTQNK